MFPNVSTDIIVGFFRYNNFGDLAKLTALALRRR
jgi:hypothetical protein